MALLFFSNPTNVILVSVNIIIAANAGGAPSPVGDLTTTILWVAGLYTAREIITLGLLPNLAMLGIPYLQLRRKVIPVSSGDSSIELVESLTRHEKIVIATAFAAFTLPVILKTTMHIPPWMSLSFGFGIVWLIAEAPNFINRMKRRLYNGNGNGNGDEHHETQLEINIEHKLRREVTISEIFFFTGVLIMVSGLRLVGGLQPIANLVYGGTSPTEGRLIIGHTVMGLLSAVFDNIPLVEMIKQMLGSTVEPGNSWVLLAATAGNGGSLLFYGSAAGVVAYGILKRAGFKFGYFDYLKMVSVPVLTGYAVMVAVWYIQYLLLR
jgi:Na+/H+ antiporter NhaD/arsenite permease-like protein